MAVSSSSTDSSDTTEIIIWFLGVSAVCAVGALLLIVCWRKFSKDEGEMDNGINLEFLLDPNHQMDPNSNLFTSPMHIEPDDAAPDAQAPAEAQEYHSMHVDVEDDEEEEEEEPVKKKKAKIKYFSRLDDGATGAGGDEDAGNDGDDDHANEEEEQSEEEDSDEEEADDLANPLMDDYKPPNFSRI